MSQNKKIKFLLFLNLLLVFSYAAFNEWEKRQSKQFEAVCQIVGYDKEENLFGVNCLKK